MSNHTTTADLTAPVAGTEFTTGDLVMAWEPLSEKIVEADGTVYWRGEYRAAKVLGVATLDGPAGEPWYIIEWTHNPSINTFRDESDLLHGHIR